MKSKLIILIVTIFSFLSMSFNEIKYQEFSTDEFTKVYVTKHPEVLDLNHIVIAKSNWTLYLPNNERPQTDIYYSLPGFICDFISLQTLALHGVFVRELPIELRRLANLKHLSFPLDEKSDIKNICQTALQIEKLETLNLTGSIISNETFDDIKRNLPKVQVSDLIRAMEDRNNKGKQD